MRYLLLSDIHANLTAFEAVLRHARLKRWDRALFLGDAVGYYPQPVETLALLRELAPEVALVGNHEASLLERVTGHADTRLREDPLVSEVLERQLAVLGPEDLAYLRSFEPRAVREGWEAVHGSLNEPWAYLTNLPKVQEHAPLMQTSLCFVGHTHIPRAFASTPSLGGELWRTVAFPHEHAVYRLPPKARIVFNPGSVGQPRDGIPLASYAIFDEEARVLEHFRVPYDLLTVQRAVRAAGYPEALAQRLALGH